MLQKVSAYIQAHGLCLPTDKLLVAVSGGIDSTVLCEVLHQLKYNFAVAHCNFGLRAEDAEADQLFVKKLAKKYEVPFFTENFNTRAFAEQEKLSIQMAARTLRYEWFEGVRQHEGYDYIATAHHSNDTTETILLHLTKGTGIAGLHGIPPKNGKIIRPLLSITKDDIYELVTERKLIWREDSSNETTKYQRNKIRHEVIPVLKEINPNLEETMQHTAERVSHAESIVAAYINNLRGQSINEAEEAVYVALEPLRSATGLPVVLHELLRPYNFSYSVVLELVEALDGLSGKQFESPTHTLVKDRDQLVLTPRNLSSFGSVLINEGDTEAEAGNLTFSIRYVEADKYKLNTKPHVAALDAAALKFPLKLRVWQEGDWFVPLGMNGKKKISDFLIDKKVPANLKGQTLVLVSDQSVAWIVGQRLDNRFKVSDKTEQVVEISMERIK
ncbi:tRNA lysidine(34) synthetase TilS [Pontibacter akesuensis]|uniref:tRNA(Ile)-lysidine synthase n=1 Tax=Pontibacter akesuensis TaxID=388950 RepID=A0A1I7K1N9_9BACT|nr:tRNA lysidine(34) synthetase TilS [Pontibacter akesuensis]GHA75791.1 tRNA(Ile)-lysidine synthase [Pontibacter akesuensis]SFU91300.1 tRNA(Ile)-lysidine synthase [Pontibacter akesuensis]